MTLAPRDTVSVLDEMPNSVGGAGPWEATLELGWDTQAVSLPFGYRLQASESAGCLRVCGS